MGACLSDEASTRLVISDISSKMKNKKSVGFARTGGAASAEESATAPSLGGARGCPAPGGGNRDPAVAAAGSADTPTINSPTKASSISMRSAHASCTSCVPCTMYRKTSERFASSALLRSGRRNVGLRQGE